MLERIKELCRERGTNLSQLEKALGFANGSLAKSDEKIQSWRLKAIADYFGVTIEYLLTGDPATYYTNPETAQIAQKVFDDPDLRMLFDAAKDCAPDQLQLAAEILRKFKATNPDG